MAFNGKLSNGMPSPERCISEHVISDQIWFAVTLTCLPFDLKIWSLCLQLHLSCKFGEIPTGGL